MLKLGLDEAAGSTRSREMTDLRAEVRGWRRRGMRGRRDAAQALNGGEATEDEPDAAQLLSTARRTLEAQASVDPALSDLAARIEEAATLVGDVSAELSAYLSSLDADPARLEQIYERRAELRALTRKYADDIEG